MGNLSVAVQQLKQERERIRKEGERIDAALLALGSVSSNGSSRRHTMSAAARRRISLAQKARWAARAVDSVPLRVPGGWWEARSARPLRRESIHPSV